MKQIVGLSACCFLWLICAGFPTLAYSQQRTEPSLIPWPQSVTQTNGTMDLFRTSRIVMDDDNLMPLAKTVQIGGFPSLGRACEGG